MAKLWLCSRCPSSSAELGLLLLSQHSQEVLGVWGLGEEWSDKKV